MCLRKYKKKIWQKFFFCILKVTEERSRIRIHYSEVWIQIVTDPNTDKKRERPLMCVDAADVKQELAVARMTGPADVAHKRLLA